MSKFKKIFKEYKSYIIIIVVVLLIRTFIITPGLVNGDSMLSTLHNNDLVIVNKIALKKGINRYDIVVVKTEETTIIKRVIGLPNEKVTYKNNKLYINDKLVDTPIEFQDTNDFELTSGDNEYIVLGDNRMVSKDSRYIGPVKLSQIKGKVNLVLFPFNRIGKVE